MKSGRAKVTLIGIGGLLVLSVTVGVVRMRPAHPPLSLRLVGYTKTNNTLIATLEFTNISPPGQLGLIGSCLITGRVAGTQTNFSFPWSPMRGVTVWVSTGERGVFSAPVTLPERTELWQCSVSACQFPWTTKSTVRQLTRHLSQPVRNWLMSIMPGERAVTNNLVSAEFDIPAEFRTP